MSKFQAVRLKEKWVRLANLVFAWILVAIIESIYIHGVAADGIILAHTPVYDFQRILWGNIFAAIAGGVISGSFLIFFLRDQLRSLPFTFAVTVNTFIIGLVNILVNSVGFSLFHYWAVSHHEQVFWSNLKEFFNSYFFLKNMLFWIIVTLITIVILRVSDKYGPGNFSKVITGGYHQPHQEERIFMFMDIRSSTTIAEKIGHIQYFNFLNDFFRDITNPILYTRGEIYQYVGDEVIISWSMKNGIHKANCLRCFFLAREVIEENKKYYLRKYGIVPSFKVGVHSGKVTTGEIGVIKKDIVFSGDVLNTTSRIQNSCNQYGVDLLLSEQLLQQLDLTNKDYTAENIGRFSLKGKKEQVVLYALK